MKSCDISESARNVLKMKTIEAKIFSFPLYILKIYNFRLLQCIWEKGEMWLQIPAPPKTSTG